MSQKCEHCKKISALCVCSQISSFTNTTQVLILQHPQESDHELGTALLTHLSLKNSHLKVGLSWPNLKAALGKEASHTDWAVLHLGSGMKSAPADPGLTSPLRFVSRKGAGIPTPKGIQGIILLDGSWSQAKTLWWRNPWLLKLKRAVLVPTRPSLYKELRKEPRRECLSTLESTAETLEALGEPSQISQALRNLFFELLNKQRLRQRTRASA